jgi:hypothetical protein
MQGQHSSYQEEDNNLSKFELFFIVVQIWKIFVIKPNWVRPNLPFIILFFFICVFLLVSPSQDVGACKLPSLPTYRLGGPHKQA